MQTNAFRFIMFSKKVCDELRRYYLEAEDGFIRFARVPFLPVYLVPTKEAKWKDLSRVLLKMVRSVRGRDWVDRFRGVKELEPELIAEWNHILKRPDDEDGSELSEEDEEDNFEAGDDDKEKELYVASKLRQVGRSQGRGPPFGASEEQRNTSLFFEVPMSAMVNASTAASTASPVSVPKSVPTVLSAETTATPVPVDSHDEESYGSAHDGADGDVRLEDDNGDVHMN
jgi:hypothetical protein